MCIWSCYVHDGNLGMDHELWSQVNRSSLMLSQEEMLPVVVQQEIVLQEVSSIDVTGELM